MEVKIGVQNAPRELTIDTDNDAEQVEKLVSDAITSGGVLSLTDARGRRVVVPAEKLAYVEITTSLTGTSATAADPVFRQAPAGRQNGGGGRRLAPPEGAGTMGTILTVLIGGIIIGLLGKLVAPGQPRQDPVLADRPLRHRRDADRHLRVRHLLAPDQQRRCRLVAPHLAGRRRRRAGHDRGNGQPPRPTPDGNRRPRQRSAVEAELGHPLRCGSR